MKYYKFSIVIPTLNEEICLPRLLEDLRRQSFKDFEVIVVDGNSEDETVERAKRYVNKFGRLTILKTKKRNVSFQRNYGAKKAATDWLLFMDADNRVPKHFMRDINGNLEITSPDMFTTWILPEKSPGKDVAIARAVNLFIEVQKSTKRPYVIESMMGLRKRVFFELNGFSEKLAWGEGSHLLREATEKQYNFVVFKTPRYVYSLRRLKKLGILKIVRALAEIESRRLLGRPALSKAKLKKIYPMRGGKFYDLESKPRFTLESMIQKLATLSPLSEDIINQIQPKTKSVIRKIKKKIRFEA